MTNATIGLRERKKRLTRESIAVAALQLAADKGLDHVTIEEIAYRAFVSPRTFSNYFSCKEEAVMTSGGWTVDAIVDAYGEAPPTEQPFEALRRVLMETISAMTEPQLALTARQLQLSAAHPTLRPFEAARYDELERALQTLIAERIVDDIDSELHASLTASVGVAALRSAIGVWSAAGADPASLPRLLKRAFDQILTGMPFDMARASAKKARNSLA